MGGPWPTAIKRLAHQLDQAQAADQRVDAAQRYRGPTRPSSKDLEPAEYQRRLRAYVQTPEYKASNRELKIAVALSKAHDAALLRAALKLLARRADGRQPPLRLPQPRILPGGYVPQWWISAINTTYAGIWRAVPAPGPELQIGGPDDPLVHEVAKQTRLLLASKVGYRRRDCLYEGYIPDGTPLGGRSLPPVPGLGPKVSRRVNLRRATGMRVQPGRDEEFDQLQTDYFAVWDRSRAYAAAVLALLRARP